MKGRDVVETKVVVVENGRRVRKESAERRMKTKPSRRRRKPDRKSETVPVFEF